jgi:DNA-binding transcriptional MerR regulator
MIMAEYTRRELAERAGVGFDSLRYYEERGILPPPKRSPANYRLYGEDAVERLAFVKRAKRCGFTLKEIARGFELIEAKSDCSVDPAEVIDEKILEIDSKIEGLIAMRSMLETVKKSIGRRDCSALGTYLEA